MKSFSGIISSIQAIAKSYSGIINDSHNLELIIPELGEIVYNEATGNYESSKATNITYQAWIKMMDVVREKNIIGTDFNRIRVEGFLTSPKNFAEEVPEQIKGKILNDGRWLDGIFYRELVLEDSLVEDFNLRALGDKIQGVFELQGTVNM